ncbi:MAG: methionyl-tRNA formyltransferase [Candidatus Limnocylindrales bacterium]
MNDGAAGEEPTGGSASSPQDPPAARTVFFGSGSFAVSLLDALVAIPRVRVEAAVSAPDRPVGRKAVLTPTPVAVRVRELGLPLLQPVRVRGAESVAALQALAPDLAILADYGQLIPRVLLDLPPRGFLNLHPSALPRHRGASPIPATILAGDTEAAVTLIVLSEEMDAGPIVAVEPLDVRAEDTAVTLEERAAEAAARLLARALPEWLAGRLTARPQPEEGITLTRPLRREDGRLDPNRPAVELERQIRAYQPWPGSYIQSENTGGERLIVWKAHVAPSQPGDRVGGFGPPSVPLVTSSEAPFIGTIDGRLVLDRLQRAGGREMGAEEYLRGHPDLGR